MSILYYSRNPNPRLASAVARHLRAPVDLEWAAPFDQPEKFSELNPSLLLPILVENGHSLWEADAIACRLSMMVRSNFWRTDADMPDMIRWISWSKSNFVHACDLVHFEFGTKQRYGLGPVDHGKVAEGERLFQTSAEQINKHLSDKMYLLKSGLSYADFRMATFLPYNDVAALPLAHYPNVDRWYRNLQNEGGWSDPFEGLHAPALLSVPSRSA